MCRQQNANLITISVHGEISSFHDVLGSHLVLIQPRCPGREAGKLGYKDYLLNYTDEMSC